MLVGEDDWVIRKESGIKYGYHIKQCMFSSGNINERRRMGEVAVAEASLHEVQAVLNERGLPQEVIGLLSSQSGPTAKIRLSST